MAKKKPSSPSRSGSPLTLLIVALISSTVFFLLGIVVGREYAIREGLVPVKEQVEEAWPIGRDDAQGNVPRVKRKQEQDQVDINFYDQLEKEGDREINRLPAEAGPGTRSPGAKRKETPASRKKSESPRAKAISGKKAGNYAIQVAAFRSKASAQRMAHALGREGFGTHVLTVTVPGKGPFYRVWVGYYGSVAESITAKKHLLQQTSVRISRATIIKR